MKRIELETAPTRNGNISQLVIDLDAQTVESGYYLFVGGCENYTRKQLNDIKNQFINAGFTEK